MDKKDKTLVCYTCDKPKLESKGKWVSAPKNEKRFVCDTCNYLNERKENEQK